ncbi:MAG: hypothetical protein AAF998_02110 [Bacteroidota bacterium]
MINTIDNYFLETISFRVTPETLDNISMELDRTTGHLRCSGFGESQLVLPLVSDDLSPNPWGFFIDTQSSAEYAYYILGKLKPVDGPQTLDKYPMNQYRLGFAFNNKDGGPIGLIDLRDFGRIAPIKQYNIQVEPIEVSIVGQALAITTLAADDDWSTT